MAVIIYTNSNGNVSVCTPTGDLSIDKVLERDCPPGAIIVNEEVLPAEYDDFFDAWRLNNGTVTVDFEAAKELTKARLRIEREPLLQAQDIAFQRALETNEDTIPIIGEKTRLRNITQLVDMVNTLEELRAIKAGA